MPLQLASNGEPSGVRTTSGAWAASTGSWWSMANGSIHSPGVSPIARICSATGFIPPLYGPLGLTR